MRGRNAAGITPLSLDDCPEPTWQQPQAEKSNEEELDTEIKNLMHQTRLWRVINSAQWVAWGIVQAETPGMEEGLAGEAAPSNNISSEENRKEVTKSTPVDADIAKDEEFDYLAYAQDRALFFWSDLLTLDLVKPDDLPPAMVEHIRARAVDY